MCVIHLFFSDDKNQTNVDKYNSGLGIIGSFAQIRNMVPGSRELDEIASYSIYFQERPLSSHSHSPLLLRMRVSINLNSLKKSQLSSCPCFGSQWKSISWDQRTG